MTRLTPGTLVLGTVGLAYIAKVGPLAGADGYWLLDPTGDPGTLHEHAVFAPACCVRPAVIGVTVCRTPGSGCGCGLRHLTAAELAQLPKPDAPSPDPPPLQPPPREPEMEPQSQRIAEQKTHLANCLDAYQRLVTGDLPWRSFASSPELADALAWKKVVEARDTLHAWLTA